MILSKQLSRAQRREHDMEPHISKGHRQNKDFLSPTACLRYNKSKKIISN